MITRTTLASLSALTKQGVGMPVVMLHGISSNAESFRSLMETLPNPCLAWDMAGYGHSPFNDEDYISQLKAFTQHLTRFTLIGSSLGALLAAKFTAEHPSNVYHLILASPASGYNTPLMPANVQARIDMLRDEGASVYAAKRAGNLIHTPESKPAILANVQNAMAQMNVQALTKASRFLSESDIHAYAKQIHVKTSVLVGTQDKITPVAGVKAIMPHFPPTIATFAEIDDAGHALIQEQPNAIARLI